MTKVKDRYINPLNDWGFKRLFGTEFNKELLIDLLNTILDDSDKKIENLEYSKNEYKGLSEEERGSVFDVTCTTAQGEKFIVEMQNEGQEFLAERLIYYSSFPVQEQGKKGKWDYHLHQIIMIAFLNFERKKKHQKKDNTYYYDIKERYTNEIMSGTLRFILIELERKSDYIDEYSTKKEKWLYVLKNIAKLQERPKALQERVFQTLFRAAEIEKLSKSDRNKYHKNMATANDIINQREYAIKMVRLESKKREELRHMEGRMEGREEGHKEKALIIAKAMKHLGIEIEKIAQATGLSKDIVIKL